MKHITLGIPYLGKLRRNYLVVPTTNIIKLIYLYNVAE